MTPTLIYCADGNKRFAEIALRRGFKYGACLPNKIYFDPFFTDQDWRKEKKAKNLAAFRKARSQYMACLEQYRPSIATVLDWERPAQFKRVLSWAEEAAQHVQEAVIIIPKVPGGVSKIPHEIGGKQIRLGYSAASTFSGTPVSISEFKAWGGPVHCLGGGPAAQMHLANQLDVVTADGNYIQNMARRYCQFYSPAKRAKSRGWPTLREAALVIDWDAPYIAFELTCIAVPMVWAGATGQEVWEVQLNWLESVDINPSIHQQSLWEVSAC